MDIKRIIIFLLSAVLVIGIIQVVYNYQKKSSSLRKIDDWLALKKLEKSEVLSFFNGNFGYNVYFDDVKNIAVFFNIMHNMHIYVKTTDILGVDVFQDGKNIDINETDALTTGKIKSLYIIVHTVGGGDDNFKMVFCNDKTRTSSEDYRNKIAFIKNLIKKIEDRM